MDDLYFGPVNDPAAYSGGGSGINWSGFGDTLTDLAKVYGGIEVSKARQSALYAVGPNGEMYMQGQRAPVQAGLSPVMLLLIVGGLIYAASR